MEHGFQVTVVGGGNGKLAISNRVLCLKHGVESA